MQTTRRQMFKTTVTPSEVPPKRGDSKEHLRATLRPKVESMLEERVPTSDAKEPRTASQVGSELD